jgi:Outer membrane protein beta-barrel domain
VSANKRLADAVFLVKFMKNWIFLLILLLEMRLDAQSHWAVGANWGVNNTEVLSRSAFATFANHATTTRWGIWGRYQMKKHWAVRAELSREQRGWKAPTSIWDDALGGASSSLVDYRYFFWALPVSVEYFWGQSARFYTSVGLAPMYQTQGTKYIRATGEELRTFMNIPSSLNKMYQWSGFVNLGYNYPIGAKWKLHSETRYSLSFSEFEAATRGYHYAYSLNLGASYQF